MKKIIPSILPRNLFRPTSSASILTLGTALVWGGFHPMEISAQYVFNGESGTACQYTGTANPPWSPDSSKTGKWITNGANAQFSGETYLNSSQEALTVENAVASFSGNLRNNSSITINNGGIVNAQSGLWIANGNYVSALTINSGGALNISGKNSFLSDNKNAVSSIFIDNGTLNAADSELYIGHHGAMTMEMKNNARLESNKTVYFAGGDNSSTTNVTAERILTIGTPNSQTDQSVFHAKSFVISRYSNGKVVLESGSIISDETITVGMNAAGTLAAHGGTIQVGGTFYVGQESGGHGVLDLQNVQLNASGQSLIFGNDGSADVQIANSTINAGLITVGNHDGASGNVIIKDSALTLSNDGPFFIKRGSLTLDNVTLNSSFTQKEYAWGSQSADGVTEFKNMTLTFENIFRLNSEENGSAAIIIGEGAALELKNGFWMANAANRSAYLEIRRGGKLSVKGTSYLTDHRTNAYGSVTVDGGEFQGDMLCVGWWGPMDFNVVNGGTVSAKEIRFNSNTDSNPSSPADSRTGDLTVSGFGSAINAAGTITFGNASRDKVTVNLNASETGFGKITSAQNIVGQNVEYVLKALSPIVIQQEYSAENGFTLMSAGGTISGFSGVLTSGNWTASLSDDKKYVAVKQNSDALGTITGTGSELALQTPAESGWVWLEPESGNPFQLTMTIDGVKSIDSMTALANFMNDSFTDFHAEAVSNEELLLTNLGTDFSNAIFAWDFSSLASAGFSNLAVTGLGGQNVPEPGTCILLILGAVGILAVGKRK